MDATRDHYTKWSQRERQIPYDITYMWNLKYDTNEPIYETEAEWQTLWVWYWQVQTDIYRMDKWQSPTV